MRAQAARGAKEVYVSGPVGKSRQRACIEARDASRRVLRAPAVVQADSAV